MTAQAPTFTASTTDFLLNTSNAAATGTDTFILKIDGFSENGVAIPVPGLNSSYGLYIEGTVALHGNPSVYGPGTISVVLDPTNNDGTPSAVWNAATQTGSVSFSNPTNTADDITLAKGDFISGSFGTQSNGQPGVHFVETFSLNPAVFGPFLSHLSSSLDIEESLFNTATSRITGPTNNGGSYVTVNDGYGIVDLTKASMVGDSGPTFLQPSSTDGAAGHDKFGAPGDSEGFHLHALEVGSPADLGITAPGTYLSSGWAALQDPWQSSWANMAPGAPHNPEPNGSWVQYLSSHGW